PNVRITFAEWNKKYQDAIGDYAKSQRKSAFGRLKNLLATGTISLAASKAKDGDRLTLKVESCPSDCSQGGIPAVFEIAIKKYGAKIQWSPSLLFVRRLSVTDAEAT